jgi:hypothetical protein
MDLPSGNNSSRGTTDAAIEAVVVILDANRTMSEEFASGRFHDDDGNEADGDAEYDSFLGTTKFDAALYAAYDIISQARWDYDTNWLSSGAASHRAPSLPAPQPPFYYQEVVSVIVLRTPVTDHHLYRSTNSGRPGTTSARPMTGGNPQLQEEGNITLVPPFPNIAELSCGDLARKVLELDVRTRFGNEKKSPNTNRSNINGENKSEANHYGGNDEMKGDIVQGIVLAADTLHRWTGGATTVEEVWPSPRKCGQTEHQHCRIVLLTDAQHKIDLLGQQQQHLLVALDSLRAMKCRLEVVGLDFHHHAEFAEAAPAPSSDQRMTTAPPANDQSMDIDSDEEENDNDDNDDDYDDDDDDEEEADGEGSDLLHTKRQNEQFLVSLASKMGGFVRSAKSTREVLAALEHQTTQTWQNFTCSSSSTGAPYDSTLNVGDTIMTTIAVTPSPLVKLQQQNMGRQTFSLQPNPGRQTFSLEPGGGRRLRWNGTDDVSLSEWIEKARPSLFSSEFCSWIQIDNVRQDSPGYENMDGLDNPPNLDEYRIPLNKIRALIQSGKRVSSAMKTKCVTEIMQIAKRDGNTVGKWLVYCTRDTADDVWETIARATAMGQLGCSAKILPTKGLPPEDRAVVCVYVKDSTDQQEVLRVLTALQDDLGITSGLSSFKPDIYTDLGIYSGNQFRLKPSLYSNAKDIFSWTFENKR